MLLGEILHRGVIRTDLKATDRFAAIDELIDLLVESRDLFPEQRAPVRDAVMTRERHGTVGGSPCQGRSAARATDPDRSAPRPLRRRGIVGLRRRPPVPDACRVAQVPANLGRRFPFR